MVVPLAPLGSEVSSEGKEGGGLFKMFIMIEHVGVWFGEICERMDFISVCYTWNNPSNVSVGQCVTGCSCVHHLHQSISISVQTFGPQP